MAINKDVFHKISTELREKAVQLVAVSKTKPVSDVLALYNEGQRDFGENYVQELVSKATELPRDIHWHFIGHLQSNKVKLIVPFVQLIHGVDSLKLLEEIDRQAGKMGRVVDCLLQVHIAREDTKFGFDAYELEVILQQARDRLPHVCIRGLMGMASFSDDKSLVRSEFQTLAHLFKKYNAFFQRPVLSMGMSGDYQLAIETGSTMVRIGSLLFGAR